MAYIINLKSNKDDRGELIAVEDNQVGFDIKRTYFIKNPIGKRGGHRHKKSYQALICLSGSCTIYNNDGNKEDNFVMDSHDKCLILEPKDWHIMQDFSPSCILQVLSSTNYDANDYIDEPYK